MGLHVPMRSQALSCLLFLLRLCAAYRSNCILVHWEGPCETLGHAASPHHEDNTPSTLGVVLHPACGIPFDDTSIALYADVISTSESHDVHNVRLIEPESGPTKVLMFRGFGPGTYFLNFTLVNVSSSHVIDFLLLCTNLVPPAGPGSWEAEVNAVSSAFYERAGPGCCPLPSYSMSPFPITSRTPHVEARPVVDAPPLEHLTIFWVRTFARCAPVSFCQMCSLQFVDLSHIGGTEKAILQRLAAWDENVGIANHAVLKLTCDDDGFRNQSGVYIDALRALPHVRYSVICAECRGADRCGDLAQLFSARSLSELPPGLLESLSSLLEALSEADVVVVLGYGPTDAPLLSLTALTNPSALRVLDMHTDCRLAELPAGVRRHLVDAIVGPSVHHALLPALRLSGIPTFAIPNMVTTGPSVPDTPAWTSVARIPQNYCGGQYRLRTCKEDPSSDWCIKDAFVFGFVGRVTPSKGIGLFLEAASLFLQSLREDSALSTSSSSIRFVVIGNGRPRYESAVQQLLAAYGLTEQVLLVGFVPPADIPVALSCMDVIVSPSLMESFSLSNIEAMAMGVPLLHFNVGGVRDYARHLVNSFVVSEKSGRGLADGMLTLVRDPNMRAVLSAGGQKAAQRYSPTVIGPHGAFVMRRAVLSHRLRASLSFATVRIVHTLRLVGQDGVDDAMNVVQSCDGKPVSRRGESETAAFACGEGIVDVRPGDAHITSYLDLTLNVDMMDTPRGFDDVLSSVFPVVRGEVLDDAARATAARQLYLEWHGQRSAVCVRYSFGVGPYETCSSTLASTVSVHQSECSAGECWPPQDVSVLHIRIPLPHRNVSLVTVAEAECDNSKGADVSLNRRRACSGMFSPEAVDIQLTCCIRDKQDASIVHACSVDVRP